MNTISNIWADHGMDVIGLIVAFVSGMLLSYRDGDHNDKS